MKTKENTLLNLLNAVFGFPDAKAARFRKIKQYFDERKAQHVVLIEFRVSRSGEKVVTPNPANKKNQRLLYQLLNMKKKA